MSDSTESAVQDSRHEPESTRVGQSRILVVGGSSKLGREICRSLAASGRQVAFTYCKGADVAEELTAEFPHIAAVSLDVCDEAAIEQAVAAASTRLGGLDAVVYCPALGVSPGDPVPATTHQRLEDVSAGGWEAMMSVNVRGAYFVSRAAAARLRAAGGGNIVLIGSVDGVKAVPSPVHYATSKAALAGMTLSLSKELGKHNIRVNLIAPGVLEDGLSNTLPAQLREEYVKHCGLERVGKLSEVASVVRWFAVRNTYVTGQVILLEGAL